MTSAPASRPPLPLLESGMRLSRAEFHALYEAHPETRHAELIDGVVYVSSPVSKHHSPYHARLAARLCIFAESAGIHVEDNITTFLPGDNEVQPDCALWCDGGLASYGDDGYLHGAPELVAEVTASSRQYDLGVKKELYRRAGVQEYLVWRTFDRQIDWWALIRGEYVPIPAGPDGVTESRVFPGLRLHLAQLIEGAG
jgi:Uma2 family endonuclease